MASNNSLDEVTLISHALDDLQKSHSDVFNTRACRNTKKFVQRRVRSEGIAFLTKTLPRLGKCLDRALSSDTPMKSTDCRFSPATGSELPRFLGEFFNRVFDKSGTVLQDPCAASVGIIRKISYLFYKYELPYDVEQETDVVHKFKTCEEHLVSTVTPDLAKLGHELFAVRYRWTALADHRRALVVVKAKRLLARVFSNFDCKDIVPRHGPGAVATGQRLWTKYQWNNVSSKIAEYYPIDEYFYSSLSHVCDRVQELNKLTGESFPAKVILVPKDSRGPRLISCEPVDFQWIQQGLGRAIVNLVEKHPLTSANVFFSNQQPNQIGALFGSRNGRYATLDLNEASDRVSAELFKLLFPSHITECLMACRSDSTKLPDGVVLPLAKFAPMGSALCFPILALSVWALLTAGSPTKDTRERILVYGDDVIVPTAYAEQAMETLESFGLKINRDKSCTKGLFRESCGMDAFNGVCVTPVRIRTVWSSRPSSSSYCSWIAYANSFYDMGWFSAYDYIVSKLCAVYGAIPHDGLQISGAPSLREPSEFTHRLKKRINKGLQKAQYHVLVQQPKKTHKVIDGWSMLLRYFTEAGAATPDYLNRSQRGTGSDESQSVFSASQYTHRRTSMLVRRWR